MKCKICGQPIPKFARKYCSKKCRQRATNQMRKDYNVEWQRQSRAEKATKSKDKIECQICHKWYRQVGTHIVQVHKMTARQYRDEYGFDVKRGQLPDDLRKQKADYVFENGTVNNLKAGKKFRFKKGQEGLGVYKRSEQTLNRLKRK